MTAESVIQWLNNKLDRISPRPVDIDGIDLIDSIEGLKNIIKELAAVLVQIGVII